MDTDSEINLPEYITPHGSAESLKLTAREKAVRDAFVKEYFKDFDYLRACTRVGFVESDAKEYAVKFRFCPYIQGQIAERQNQQPEEHSELDHDAIRAKLINGLLEDAVYNGHGASHGARVKAKSELARLLDMEPARKVEANVVSEQKQTIDFDNMTEKERDLLRQLLKSRADVE